MTDSPKRLLNPCVRITPHQFSMLRIALGLAMAGFFIGMHVGLRRLPVELPLSVPRGGELLERLNTYILAANASTIFCITGVAASLLLSLGYFRRFFALVVLFRLYVVVHGHWLQLVSGILPAIVLLFFIAAPGGAPWALLQKRRNAWSIPRWAATTLWITCSLVTAVFIVCALAKQLDCLQFQRQAVNVTMYKCVVVKVVMVVALLVNLLFPWRSGTRRLLWAFNLVCVLLLAVFWFTDRHFGLMPRVWQPWSVSITILYVVIWGGLFDAGLMKGRAASEGTRRLVLFDGFCGLCNGAVRFLLDEDVDKVLSFATLQGETAAKAVVSAEGDTIMYVRDYGSESPQVLTYSSAALQIARDVGGIIGLLATVGMIVPKPLRDLVYRIVAKFRYRIFGKYDMCPMPTEETRSRFLE